MLNFITNGKELIVNGKLFKFQYPIYKAQEYNETVIVLLEFKNINNPLEFTNALYAISSKGQLHWKMEDIKRVLGTYQPAPLVDFAIINNELIAFDFYSRKFILNPTDGKIIEMQTGRW